MNGNRTHWRAVQGFGRGPALLAIGVALLAGCVTYRNPIVLDAVGPVPGLQPANSNGTLVVYSAYDVIGSFNQPHNPRHTPYDVRSETGQRLRRVRNCNGTLQEGPAQVQLAPGRYRVVAQANGYGEVTVPVVIEPDRLTMVQLQGSPRWPNREKFLESGPVCLPHGEPVGWRASSRPVAP